LSGKRRYFLSLPFNFASEYAIRKVYVKREGFETTVNRRHQFLVYAGDINLLNEDLTTIEKNTEALLWLVRDGVEVNVEKSKCIFMSCLQNIGDNYNKIM
jgi:hypothetical protein